MQTKIMFMRLTDQGRKSIKDAPGRIEAGIKGWEKMGGKMLGFYVTYGGEYDYIAISQSPSEAVANAFKAMLELQGNVRTWYENAISPEEFAAYLKNLP